MVPRRRRQRDSEIARFDCNINNLTYSFETGEGGIGAPFKSIVGRIYKVQEGDTLPGEQILEKGGFRAIPPCGVS